jgi:hypothetical protein
MLREAATTQGRWKDQLVTDIGWRKGKLCLKALRGKYWWCDNVHGKAARWRFGVAEREAEASAHDTAVHHVWHPSFKHMARYTLHNMKPSKVRADMHEAAQREGSGVGKVSDANMGWDSCPRHANG